MFDDISYLEILGTFCLALRNPLFKFGKSECHFREIILNLTSSLGDIV